MSWQPSINTYPTHVTQGPYKPHNGISFVNDVAKQLKNQQDLLEAIWEERGFQQTLAFAVENAEHGGPLFRAFYESFTGFFPQFLSLLTDPRLPPLSDKVWYELANHSLTRGLSFKPFQLELLRQNAPSPKHASPEAVAFFHRYVGGEPPKALSKTKSEAFTEKVNPPGQGLVMLSAKLKQGELGVASPKLPEVRQVAPQASESQAEQELKVLREQFRQLQVAKDKEYAEKERLQRELEQKNAAKPAAAPNEKFQCTLCRDKEIEIIYSDCRHSFCQECAEEWNERKNKIECPTCRQTSKKIEQLFIG